MDISQITIPSKLFYSNSPSNQSKPRCISQLNPSQVAMQMKLQKLKSKFKNDNKISKSRNKGRISKVKPIKPQLGRIVKPKKTSKPKKILKESNNNIMNKPVQTQHKIISKEMESPKPSSPSFKFFKSRNIDSPSTNLFEFESKISPSRHEQYSLLQFSSQEEDEQDIQTTQTIEALIGALGHDDIEEQSRESSYSCYSSIDGLINTLEGKK
jgi:hypothetical protein